MTITPTGFTSALSYETDYSYDAADRVHTMTYPADIGAQEIVTTMYNALTGWISKCWATGSVSTAGAATTGATAACTDGDCTNEAHGAGRVAQSVNVILNMVVIP